MPITLQVLAVLLAGLVFRITRRGCQPIDLSGYDRGRPAVYSQRIGRSGCIFQPHGRLSAGVRSGGVHCRRAGTPGWRTVLAALAGIAVIYLGGASWLAIWLGGDWAKAWTLGVTPFITADVAKAVLAVAAAGVVRRVFGSGAR